MQAPGTSPHCQVEMASGWARTIRNKIQCTSTGFWIFFFFFASMQTKHSKISFHSKFSPGWHTLYVGGMTGEPVWSCSACFSSSGSWSPPQAALQETYQTNTTDCPTDLTMAYSPKVIAFRLDKAHPLLYEALSGLCSSSQPQLFISIPLPLPSLVTLAGRAGGCPPVCEPSLNLLERPILRRVSKSPGNYGPATSGK